jgi:hypothetical protein
VDAGVPGAARLLDIPGTGVCVASADIRGRVITYGMVVDAPAVVPHKRLRKFIVGVAVCVARAADREIPSIPGSSVNAQNASTIDVDGRHMWDRCTCVICGVTRDAHDWEVNATWESESNDDWFGPRVWQHTQMRCTKCGDSHESVS